MAGAFLHERFAEETLAERPHFAGWWGHRKSDRFKMGDAFVPSPGIAGWQLSNPPVLPMAALRASLDVFTAAGGMGPLRAKSEALTGYMEALLARELGMDSGSGSGSSGEVRRLTPADPAARGAQLSLSFSLPVRDIYRRLGEEGVIVDIREVRGGVGARRQAPTVASGRGAAECNSRSLPLTRAPTTTSASADPRTHHHLRFR
jgi:kynureninase